MQKQISKKVAVFAIVTTFVLSIGVICCAQMMWTYLMTCSYTLDMDYSTPSYDVILVGGSTTTVGGKYAYVKAELQRYINGSWRNFHVATDSGYMMAAVEDDVMVVPGYTYRVKTTHQAKDADGNILEQFVDISDYGITSDPRP